MDNKHQFCASCGGRVDAQGLANGGEVEGDELHDEFGDDIEPRGEVGDESGQRDATARLRRFAEALKGGK